MNIIKKVPKVGDIFIIVDGKKRFISGSECTEEFINKQQAVGVVYNVSRTTFDVVAGVNDKNFPWSIACATNCDKNVDLPSPLAPTSATCSPFKSLKLTFSKTLRFS